MGKKNKKTIKMLDYEQQQKMQYEIRQKYGDKRVNESNRNFNSMDKEMQQRMMEECNEIFGNLAEHIHKDPYSDEVREILIRWHEWIRNFYNPSMEVLRGLGEMYFYSPDFRKTFEEIDPGLPDFLPKAINSYVEELEDKWLEAQYETLEH